MMAVLGEKPMAIDNREVAERGAPTETPSDGALPGDARWDRGALRTQSPERTITRAAQALAREITASALGSDARAKRARSPTLARSGAHRAKRTAIHWHRATSA